MSELEIKLSRSNRIYRPDEPLQGKIITKFSSSVSHYGVRLSVNGSVNLQVRGGSAGVIESVVGVLKPITIVKRSVEIRPSGKISSGTTEIPFSLILKQPGERKSGKFYETFHGEDISIQYLLTVEVARGYLHKSLSATLEFIIESEKGGFRVSGRIPTQCSLSCALRGELTVEASALPIQSIDIHLLRVESILVGDRIASETSLIQTTQIADGDISRGLTLPIYVLLPRLLTCPSVLAGPFSIEFKVSIVINFQSELSKLHPKSDPRTPRLWLAMETLPLELVRTR
ncbi:Down syndrome critical region protein 3 homolog isoform X2 [Chenopodium quinoa]|uniref:Down syndrome critical region protein 3 homolog isoform X2 n=1 Tax=Chenopodium quinoa TaxID=63459 RepID=UPI000B7946E3|nr:Down syndrome critical region protein 3 homolog isoform X2 [Chenopodium quinoa]